MEAILADLKQRLPTIDFIEGQSFRWSPTNKTVSYIPTEDNLRALSLLHEASHAILEHIDYSSDFALLLMEVAAWEEARSLAYELGIEVDEDYIQDRLDSYRDWLHQRSTCPRCNSVSLQAETSWYHCHNCSATWQVSTSRFCRPYRQTKNRPENKAPDDLLLKSQP